MLPSDPDIETIVGRIKSGELDLQPDFQRGEVWPDSKKRRLIDTILREWHVPPIHVVENSGSYTQEVLDGQQRLVAIRDFVFGKIQVDGLIDPIEPEIEAAHGCVYQTLPPNLRRKFDRFTIRVFRLTDFKPEEPGELFFRLNQPTSLTSAEQRNAFFGPVRQQVRKICEQFPKYGLSDKNLGFSNSRMAFDDIVAKLCLTIERSSLLNKITAASITERYRSQVPFPAAITLRASRSLEVFGKCISNKPEGIRFNKATLLSWLTFISRDAIGTRHQIDRISSFLHRFELERAKRSKFSKDLHEHHFFPNRLLEIFTDRSSLRVGDVSSVLLRDAILCFCFLQQEHFQNDQFHSPIQEFKSLYDEWNSLICLGQLNERELLALIEKLGWGAPL